MQPIYIMNGRMQPMYIMNGRIRRIYKYIDKTKVSKEEELKKTCKI